MLKTSTLIRTNGKYETQEANRRKPRSPRVRMTKGTQKTAVSGSGVRTGAAGV